MPGRLRQCPRCNTRTVGTSCCGIDLTVRRRAWRMTRERIRVVHVVARARKGLDDETYRLRLVAVGADTCKQFTREQFLRFMLGLRQLPDVPTRRAGRAA